MTQKKPVKKQTAKKQATKKQATPQNPAPTKTIKPASAEPTKKSGRPTKTSTSAAPTKPVININNHPTTPTAQEILQKLDQLLQTQPPKTKWHTRALHKLNRRLKRNAK